MEKIYIKKCEKSGYFIARYEDKFGRILNSQFVPIDKSKIIEYDFNSCLGWEEFKNVEEFINIYFFNIEKNSIEKNIKDKKTFEELKLLNASKKNLKGLKKYIKNEYLEKNIIGFSVEVQEYDNSANVLDDAIYDKKKSFDALEESYKNYQEELKNMFIFQSCGDYKTVSLYIIYEIHQKELLDDEFTFFQDNLVYSRKKA